MALVALFSARSAPLPGAASARRVRYALLMLEALLLSIGFLSPGFLSPACAQNVGGMVRIEQGMDVPDGLKYRIVRGAEERSELRDLPGRADRWINLDLGTTSLSSDDRLVIVSENLNRIAEVSLKPLHQDRIRKRDQAVRDRTNLVPNGDFRRGPANWQVQAAGGGAVLGVSRQTARIQISGASALENQIRLACRGLMLEEGQPYVLRFRARASKSRDIAVATQLDALTADRTGLRREETLTPQWKEYVFNFIAERPATALKGAQNVTFRYMPLQPVTKVGVAGEFNGWKSDNSPMEFDGKSWKKTLALGPGNHEYKFMVDDQWTNDPNAPLVNDNEGHMNNVVRVGYANRLLFLFGGEPGTVEIQDVVLQLDRMASKPEMRAALNRADFKALYTVQVPVTYKDRAAYDVTVGLRCAGQEFAPVTLSTADNGVARFENIPAEAPVTVTVTHGDQRFELSDRPVEGTTGMVSGVTLPANWTGVLTLPGVPLLRANPSAGGAAATPVIVVPAASSGGDNRMLYTIAGFLTAMILVMVGVVWMLEARRRNQSALPAARPMQTVAAPAAATTALPARSSVTAALVAGERPKPVPLPEPVAAGHTSQPAEESPRLVGVHGVYNGYSFTLSPAFTEIGRDIMRGVALPQDHNVSRRHAVLQYADGEFIVTDEGSSNGTYINGVRIPANAPHPLHSGDEVQFGSSRFRFEV